MKKLLLIISLFIFCPSAWADITTGLQGYWKFDEGSGSTATDSSGNGNDGTEENSPTYITGVVGSYALSFNGSNQYVDLGTPGSLDLSGANAFTLSAWVYATSTPTGRGIITEMYAPSNQTVQYEIGFGLDTGTDSQLKVGFYDNSQSGWYLATDPVSFGVNQWTFIAGTWDGTNLVLYKNGTQIAATTPGGHLPSTYIDDYAIGSRHDNAYGNQYFPGYIDDARIYNRALSSSDITQLYNLGVAPIVAHSAGKTEVIFLLGSTWTVPSDWNSANNTIEVIGGGGGGSAFGDGAGGGGGGGAYSKATNVTLTPGSTVNLNVGGGGGGGPAWSSTGSDGTDTYFCNSTSNCASISGAAVVAGAKGGGGANSSGSGAGGSSASGIGSLVYSGGNGGSLDGTNYYTGAGAGGAAGPNGNGGNGGAVGYAASGGGGNGGGSNGGGGSYPDGGNGGNNYSGSGGGAGAVSGGSAATSGSNGGGGGGGAYSSPSNGANGSNGNEWSSYGSGGGGGGGGDQSGSGGIGGFYGGGGGGGGTYYSAGSGGPGIIVVTYTPSSNGLWPFAYYARVDFPKTVGKPGPLIRDK